MYYLPVLELVGWVGGVSRVTTNRKTIIIIVTACFPSPSKRWQPLEKFFVSPPHSRTSDACMESNRQRPPWLHRARGLRHSCHHGGLCGPMRRRCHVCERLLGQRLQGGIQWPGGRHEPFVLGEAGVSLPRRSLSVWESRASKDRKRKEKSMVDGRESLRVQNGRSVSAFSKGMHAK